MYYNQFLIQQQEISMPLLMRFTNPTKIQEIEDEPIMYDPICQIVYDMGGSVRTKCSKTITTKVGHNNGKLDKKNYIDDSKSAQ